MDHALSSVPRRPSGALAAAFSNAGHFLMHYFVAMFFTIILAIEKDWGIAYADLMAVWFPASLMIGLCALPAGRLADKWSSPGMLIVMFLGMGIVTVFCGFMSTETGLMIFLAAMGVFAAIYHPVGIPWIIKTARRNTGMRLAVNGVFGGLGAAGAAMITGWIIEGFGWRYAFILPGFVCALIGGAMAWALATGRIGEGAVVSDRLETRSGAAGNLKAVALMLIPMFALGLIYNSLQNAMPKLFEERMLDLLDGRIGLIGTAVGLVYAAGAVMQLIGGVLADRLPLKTVYVGFWLLQAPLLLIIADHAGMPLILAVAVLTMAGAAMLPTENMMLSRFAPKDHQGLTFGVKFVVSFLAAPLGVYLIKTTREATGSFEPLLLGLAAAAALVIGVVALLPRSEPSPTVARPAAAE
jgi:FSR family fosmidomycin resistance protein-like MFS transporter